MVLGPSFKGLFGREVEAEDGQTYTADENYIRESILEPQTVMVKGFQPVMPSFKGILSDNDIDALIASMKSLN